MRCPFCENEISDQSKFCGKCGREIPRCPTCGRVLTKKSKYCSADGTLIPENVLSLIPASEREELRSKIATENVKKDNKLLILAGIISLLVLIIVILSLYLAGNKEDVESVDEKVVSTTSESITVEVDENHDDIQESAKKNQIEKNGVTSESENNPISSQTALVKLEPPKGNYFEVTLSGASATSVLEPESEEYHYEPYRAIDNDIITSWQEGAKGDGIGETLTVYFEKESSVKYICLWGGNWRADEQFWNNNRPQGVKIKIGEEEFSVRFSDGMKERYIVLRDPIKTDRIAITIESVYKGLTSEDICISEVKVYS